MQFSLHIHMPMTHPLFLSFILITAVVILLSDPKQANKQKPSRRKPWQQIYQCLYANILKDICHYAYV